MKITLMHDHYDQEHLDHVTEEMKTLGAPRIKAIWMECWCTWVALEGCHRLRAAKVLGLTPEIEAVDYNEDVMASDLGLDWEDDAAITSATETAHRRTTLTFKEA